MIDHSKGQIGAQGPKIPTFLGLIYGDDPLIGQNNKSLFEDEFIIQVNL